MKALTMAFPKQFEKYQCGQTKEADFCREFVAPLLLKMGFSMVRDYHGNREKGKDFVFADLDRFGHVSYHALQAKCLPSIGKNDVAELARQTDQAFNHPFLHPETGAEERISLFYIVNAGSIDQNRREDIFAAVSNQRVYCEHVRIFDGKDLLQRDEFLAMTRVDSIGGYIRGLIVELHYNRRVTESLLAGFREFISAEKGDRRAPSDLFRLSAIDRYLQCPLLPQQVDTNLLFEYWQKASSVNHAVTTLMPSFGNKLEIAESQIAPIDWLKQASRTIGECLNLAVQLMGLSVQDQTNRLAELLHTTEIVSL